MSISTRLLPGTVSDPLYPESDGEPMGETGLHVIATLGLYATLRSFLADRHDVYVAADMFLYFEKGNPSAVKSPDVMVIKGVGNHERLSFRTWEENNTPCVVFEVTSQSTRKEDFGEKRNVYARLGIAEYFMFDPQAEYLHPDLQGYRLQSGQYVPLTPAEDGSLPCEELGLRFISENGLIRLIDAGTGKPIPTSEERADLAEQLAESETRRAEESEAEIARLRAELSRFEKNERNR